MRLDDIEPSYRVHEAADGTRLVVCDDCGFEWDAEHRVHDDEGNIGYECPRCVIDKLVAAREQVIKEAATRAAETMAVTFRAVNARLRNVALMAAELAKQARTGEVDDDLIECMRKALLRAGYDSDNATELQPAPTPGEVSRAVELLREERDPISTRGRAIIMVCDELELLQTRGELAGLRALALEDEA